MNWRMNANSKHAMTCNFKINAQRDDAAHLYLSSDGSCFKDALIKKSCNAGSEAGWAISLISAILSQNHIKLVNISW